MNLLELQEFVDIAVQNAKEFRDDPEKIIVSIQINDEETEDVWSDDIELTYDGDGIASGCVIHGWKHKH